MHAYPPHGSELAPEDGSTHPPWLSGLHRLPCYADGSAASSYRNDMWSHVDTLSREASASAWRAVATIGPLPPPPHVDTQQSKKVTATSWRAGVTDDPPPPPPPPPPLPPPPPPPPPLATAREIAWLDQLSENATPDQKVISVQHEQRPPARVGPVPTPKSQQSWRLAVHLITLLSFLLATVYGCIQHVEALGVSDTQSMKHELLFPQSEEHQQGARTSEA